MEIKPLQRMMYRSSSMDGTKAKVRVEVCEVTHGAKIETILCTETLMLEDRGEEGDFNEAGWKEIKSFKDKVLVRRLSAQKLDSFLGTAAWVTSLIKNREI